MRERISRWLKELVHNTFVHPVLPFLPLRVAQELHDRNADWAFGVGGEDEGGQET